MSATIDYAAALVELNLLALRAMDPLPVFEYAGEIGLSKVRERIMYLKESPDGEPWAPWTDFTATSRALAGTSAQGLLWDTGTLLNSFQIDIDGDVEVSVGTDLDYAKELHEGLPGKMAARPIVGWDVDDYALILSAATRYFNEGALT